MDDEFPNDGRKVLMWLETPLNPFGTSFSIEHCPSTLSLDHCRTSPTHSDVLHRRQEGSRGSRRCPRSRFNLRSSRYSRSIQMGSRYRHAQCDKVPRRTFRRSSRYPLREDSRRMEEIMEHSYLYRFKLWFTRHLAPATFTPYIPGPN